MSKKFDDILNECLNRMAAGEDMEQCLRDYPDLSNDLRPLLETASMLKTSSDSVQPGQQFKALIGQRILAEARARAEEYRKPKWYAFWQWQHQWAIALVAVVVIVFAGGATTVAASSNAMPDDFLYPVKLAVEDVRLTFAGSDIDKAELQAEFANRRVNEIARMAEEEKWDKVEATAERLSNHLQKIVDVAAKKRVSGELDREDIAKLMSTMLHYASDHPLIFRKAVEQMPKEENAVVVKLLQVAKTQYAETIEDLNIAVRENTGQSDVGTATELDGVVRMIVDGKWVVGDQVVNVDKNTVLNVAPAVGTSVKVEAQFQHNGSLDARKITPYASVAPSRIAPEMPRPTPVQTLETPSGMSVVTPDIVSPPSHSSKTDPAPSTTAVEATDSISDETTDDVAIPEPAVRPTETPKEVLDVPEIRTFTGIIRDMNRSHWTIGTYTVTIANTTVIRGNAQIGQSASVWVTVQPDGSLLAYTIWAQNDDLKSTGVTDNTGNGFARDPSTNSSVESNIGVVDSPQASVEPGGDSNTMSGE